MSVITFLPNYGAIRQDGAPLRSDVNVFVCTVLNNGLKCEKFNTLMTALVLVVLGNQFESLLFTSRIKLT